MQFYHGNEHYYLTQIFKNDIALKEKFETTEQLEGGDYYLFAYKLADLYANNMLDVFSEGLSANEIYDRELAAYENSKEIGGNYISFLGYEVDYPKSLVLLTENRVYYRELDDTFWKDAGYTIPAIINPKVIYHEMTEDNYFWKDEDDNYYDCDIVYGYYYNGALYEDETHTVIIALSDDKFKVYIDYDTNIAYNMSYVRNPSVSAEQAVTIQNLIYETYEVDKLWYLEQNRSLYIAILQSILYGSIKHFFYENRHKFLPQFDWYLIEEDGKRKVIIDTLFKEYDRFTNIVDSLSNFSDPDAIPDNVLIYMMELVGLTVNDYQGALEESQVRSLIKNLVEVYRYKGSLFSFELFFGCMGIDCGAQELFFDRRLFYNSTGTNPWTRVESPTEFAYYLTPNNPLTSSYSYYVGEGKKNARKSTTSSKDSVTWSDITYPISEHVWEQSVAKIANLVDKDQENAIKSLLGFLAKGDQGYYDFGDNAEIFTYYKSNFVLFNFSYIGNFRKGDTVTKSEKEIYAALVDKILPIFIQKYYTNIFIETSREDDILHYGIDSNGNTSSQDSGGFNFRDTDTYESYQYYLLSNPTGGGNILMNAEKDRVKYTSPWNWPTKGAYTYGDITRATLFYDDYRITTYLHSADSYCPLGYASNDAYGYKVFVNNKNILPLADGNLYHVNNIIDGYYYNNSFYADKEHTIEIEGEAGKYYVDLLNSNTYLWSEDDGFYTARLGVEKLGPWYIYKFDKGFVPLSVQYRAHNRYYNKAQNKWFIFDTQDEKGIVEYDATHIYDYTDVGPYIIGGVYRKADGTYLIRFKDAQDQESWVNYNPLWDRVDVAYTTIEGYGTVPAPFEYTEDGIYHDVVNDTYFIYHSDGIVYGNLGAVSTRIVENLVYGFTYTDVTTGDILHKFYNYTVEDGIQPYPATSLPEGSYVTLIEDNPFYTKVGSAHTSYLYKPDFTTETASSDEFYEYDNSATRYNFSEGELQDEEYYALTTEDNSSTALLASDPFSYTSADFDVNGGYGYADSPTTEIYAAKVNFDEEGNPAHTSDFSLADLVENGFHDVIGGRIIDENIFYKIKINGIDTWVSTDNQRYYKYVQLLGGECIIDVMTGEQYAILDRKNDKSVYKINIDGKEYWQFFDGDGKAYLVNCVTYAAYEPSSRKPQNFGYYYEGQFYSDKEHQHPLYTKSSIEGTYKGEVAHYQDLFDNVAGTTSHEGQVDPTPGLYSAEFTIQKLIDAYTIISANIGDIYQVNEEHEGRPAGTWYIWTGTTWDAMTPETDSICADITNINVVYYIYNGTRYREFGFPHWKKVSSVTERDGRYYLDNSVRVYPELLIDVSDYHVFVPKPSYIGEETLSINLEPNITINPAESALGTFAEEGQQLFEHSAYTTRMSTKPALNGRPGYYIDDEENPNKGLGKFYEVERYVLTSDTTVDRTKTYFRYNAQFARYDVVTNAKDSELSTYYEYEVPGALIIPVDGQTYVDITDERKPKYYVWSDDAGEWKHSRQIYVQDGIVYVDKYVQQTDAQGQIYLVRLLNEELTNPVPGVIYRDVKSGKYYIYGDGQWLMVPQGKYVRQIVPGTTYITGDDLEAVDAGGNPYYEINMDYYEYTNPIERVDYDLNSNIIINII